MSRPQLPKPSPNRSRRQWGVRWIVVIVCLTGVVTLGNDVIRWLEGERESESRGRAGNGSVTHAVRLPSSGPNFETYSRLGSLVGRTYVHHQVHDSVLDAYLALEESRPGVRFVYGETGWPGGGDFWPHRTHQNGLVVDFMTPVVDTRSSEPTTLGTWPWHGFGYLWEFDESGQNDAYEIDWESMAAHLEALDAAARANGLRIKKVIFAPELRQTLIRATGDRKLRQLPWSKRPVWVRHDDHYHVEFSR